MRSKTLVIVGFAAAVVSCFCAPSISAQAVYGSIIGTITDPQGAAVPGAKVTVTSVTKGTSDQVTTNADGNYSVTHLSPGVYNVKTEAPGFKSFEAKNIPVSVDSAARVDGQFVVGTAQETVEVTAEAPQLKTDRADVATTFSEAQVESLPLYNRNFTSLQLLSPGNQRMNGWNHAASENPQGSQQILTQGQHFAGTGFELDGTDNQDPILGIIVINPNLEAVTEVKVTSQNYDAEFGKAIGAVVTSQTKSGSNSLHGSVFDFQRSNSNFAQNPFTQGPGTPGVPGGNWNQFGAAVGGPIKKDKIFFFGDYQGQRSHIGGSTGERIPTAAERLGDFSEFIDSSLDPSARKVVYDPFETTDASHATLVLDGSGQPIPVAAGSRTAFPGNIIPASRISPQATALLGSVGNIPVGADLAPADLLTNNFFGSGTNVLDSNGFDVRIDAAATQKTTLFGRYSFQQFTRFGPGLFGDLAGGKTVPSDPSVGDFAGTSKVRNQSLAAGFNYTVTNNWLTDFRFGYFRYRVNVLPGGFGSTPATDAGIPGLNVDNFYTTGMPYFAIRYPGSGIQSLFSFGYGLGAESEGHCNCPLTENEHQYQFVNNWTHIVGNHQIKFGVDLRRAYNLRVPSDAHRAGELKFNNDVTQGPGGDGGIGMAGFLLGAVSQFNRYVSVSTDAYETQPRFFFYGKDTWRITPKLTLDYGLRWELFIPESASGAGKGGWVDLATGETRVAGQQGVNLRGNTDTSYTHFAPRLGIAYQLTPKSVLRMGYGRSYDVGVFGSIFGHAITQNLPVLANQSLNPGATNAAFLLANGPPSGDPAAALQNNCNAITDPTGVQPDGSYIPTHEPCVGPNGRNLWPDGIGGHSRPFNNRIPTVDAWNVSLQQQLTPSLSATVAYVGNKGTHTFIADNPAYNINNQTVVGYDPNCTALPCANGALPQNLRKPFYSLYGWTQGMDFLGNNADTNYNSLQVTAEKRFSGGLQFQSSYTFQHANNYEPTYFNIDRKVNYGPSNDYRNHVFILTELYDLPFGRGKKFAGNVSRAAEYLVGGWKLVSSWNFSGGLPFTPGLNSCSPSSDIGGPACRPDKVGSVKDGARSGNPRAGGYWFETTDGVGLSTAGQTAGPWGQPALDTFGNVGRNSYRGPKFFNIDASLFKTIPITETVRAELQFQFFNVLNHVNFDLPNSCVDCGNGASISNIAYGSTMRQVTFGAKVTF
jgi:Carboxypeptidase regulatory-like domain/TonB dependent receptor-like, beta-barrel